MNKQSLFKTIVVVSLLSILFVFIFSLLIVTTDAQGVFIFIVTTPVMVILGLISIFVSLKVKEGSPSYFQFTKFLITSLLVFLFSIFIPIVNQFPEKVIDGVAAGFSIVTGKTPRQFFRDRNNLEKLIQAELQKTNGQKVDFSKINTAYNWNRLCVFIPYTSDEVADQRVGNKTELSRYSNIASSDSINVIALFDDTSLVNYANMSRSLIDFELQEAICVPRASAIVFRKKEKFEF